MREREKIQHTHQKKRVMLRTRGKGEKRREGKRDIKKERERKRGREAE